MGYHASKDGLRGGILGNAQGEANDCQPPYSPDIRDVAEQKIEGERREKWNKNGVQTHKLKVSP